MGIIQRQALRNTIINFAGAILGGITRMITPIVTPSNAEQGLLNLLDTISAVFVTFFSLGYSQILVKMFPRFRDDENGHHGFLLFGVFLSLLGIGISFIIFYFFGHLLVTKPEDMTLFKKFSLLIFPMIFFRILFVNVDGYAKMLYQTFIGVFLDTFLSRAIIIVSIVLYAFFLINFDQFVYLYAFSFCIPGLLVLIFAFFKTKKVVVPSPLLLAKKERKKIYEYILFGVLFGASGSIVLYIDNMMIVKMISLEESAFYLLFFFAARFILIPGNSINRIALVVLAEAWEKEDKKTVAEVYQKSCVNQMLIAAFLLGLGWTILNPVLNMHIKYADYIPHAYLFLILGAGVLIEMATGVNAAIIATSKHYQYNTYFNVVLAVLVVILNYFFIKEYQLAGAAIASAIAMTSINFFRWLLLYKKYSLQPFDLNFVKAMVFSLAFLTFCVFLNYEASPFLKIAINLIGLTALFWGLAIALKFSTDVNKWLLKMKTKFF